MKQYTDKDQTAKLIELGFPKPQSIVGVNIVQGDMVDISGHYDAEIEFERAYSIGELIEFIKSKIYRIENDMQWIIEGRKVYGANEELIDALFCACITLKEEGVI